MPIAFYTKDIAYNIQQKRRLKQWVSNCVEAEKFICRRINFILCSDAYLYQLNLKYLRHDTLTDVITFDYSEEKTLEGEVYISFDRVKENAEKLNISLTEELHRVMIHGVLHLVGYNDHTAKEKEIMRAKETACLSQLHTMK